MGVTPVGNIYKSLTFDGKTSKSYNVYITGEAVFNAPERSVEMITIPGRNGAYALDNGRFENIEVTYPASIVADNEADFAAAVSDFRNFLCSRSGYCRLTDDYNPNEYRMAIYKSGLEVDAKIRRAGEFNITFECKPQRWLTSGETAVTVADSDTLTNPTYFESSPLLASLGYGNIAFNGYEVKIDNEPLGVITLVGEEKYTSPIQLDLSNVNTGDDIILQLERTRFSVTLDGLTSKPSNYVFDPCVDSNSDFSSAYLWVTSPTVTSYTRNIVYQTYIAEPLTFKKGTSKTITNTVTSSFQCNYNGTTYTVSFSVTESIAYNGTTHEITMSTAGTVTTTLSGTQSVTQVLYYITSIMADSTKSAVSDAIFIDCEIGECWTIQGGNIISLNGLITLGSDLPTLAPGTNTFTFDNTITQLEVTPRWWKV